MNSPCTGDEYEVYSAGSRATAAQERQRQVIWSMTGMAGQAIFSEGGPDRLIIRFVIGKRTVREEFFCQLQSSRDDQEVRDSEWHRIKKRRRIFGPSNHENQWDVERQDNSNDRPEPDVFPQVPADFDGKEYYA
jgi:hypothetical protein